MSGENWDPAWRQGRDLYRDAWLVSQQAWFAHEVARRFGGHEAIVGWLVSNEMPLYGGPATSEEIVAWARALVEAVRSAGATQPISLGDGAWGVEVDGPGQRLLAAGARAARRLLRPPRLPDAGRPGAPGRSRAAFACELAGGFGNPVVLEEFGVSSDFASDDNAAGYYRQVLHTLAARGRHAAGSPGTTATTTTSTRRTRTGITSSRCTSASPTGQAGRSSSCTRWPSSPRSCGELSGTGLGARRRRRGARRAGALRARAAVHRRGLPQRPRRRPSAVVRRRAGGGPPDRDPPRARRPARHRAPLPRPQREAADGPRARSGSRALATSGATVYASYFAGSTPSQRGPWLTWLDEIFGIRHRLRYGLVDPIEDEEVVFELVEELGDLEAGTRLRFRVAGEPSARSYLPVDPVGARVIAVDGHGRPALLRHALGAGSTVFCAYPLEHMAARTPRVNPEDTWQALRGARDARRRARGRYGSTTRASSWAGSGAVRPKPSSSSTLRATPCRPSRWSRTGNPWNPPERSPSARSAWRSPAARSPRRSGQRREVSRRSPASERRDAQL